MENLEIIQHLLFIDQYLRKNKEAGPDLIKEFGAVSTELLRILIDKDPDLFDNPDKNATASILAMVAHSVDLEFQKEVLNIIKSKYFEKVAKSTLAILEDKILIKETGKQKFGTQFKINTDDNGNKTVELVPLNDPDKADEFRQEYGMETIQEYIAKINENISSLRPYKSK